MRDDLDTTAARAEILARIRTLQNRPSALKPAEQKRANDYMAAHTVGPQPNAVPDVLALFIERAKAMLCSVDEVANDQEAVQACATYLETEGLAGQTCIWPSLSQLDWSVLGSVHFREAQGEDLIGISGVAHAVAETGTLVFSSQPDEPSSTHLLVETHIALVKASQVKHTMEHVFAARREAGLAMPRAFNFVSGPSRTADIEQTIVLGAHGPYRVHIVLIRDTDG